MNAVLACPDLQSFPGLSLFCRDGLVTFYESVGFETSDREMEVPEGGTDEPVRMVYERGEYPLFCRQYTTMPMVNNILSTPIEVIVRSDGRNKIRGIIFDVSIKNEMERRNPLILNIIGGIKKARR